MPITIKMSLFAPGKWNSLGLDAPLDDASDGAEVRNEWPSDTGDSFGEMFGTVEGWITPDGDLVNVLFWTNWNSQWSPWTHDSTWATIYDRADANDMAAWARDVAEWEGKPETDPDYEDTEDTEDTEDDDVPNLDGRSNRP